MSKPKAWMRRWAYVGEKPIKHKNENGRLAWPFKFKLLPVTQGQCLLDDVPLYATDHIDQLEARIKELEQDAARWGYWRKNASEQFLHPNRAGHEMLPDLRTHWVGPTLVCSGPVGGWLSVDKSIDVKIAAMKDQS